MLGIFTVLGGSLLYTFVKMNENWTAAIQSSHRAATQSTSSADSADSFGGGAVVGGILEVPHQSAGIHEIIDK